MRKQVFLSLVILSQIPTSCLAQGMADASVSLQKAVEQGLRQPVVFANETVSTFSLTERLAFYQVPGLSFALIDQGKVAWSRGYGRLSATSNQPVTRNTVFQAASLAKPVTAFAVMRMHANNKIDIHSSVTEYLESYQLPSGGHTAGASITLKNLLDHSSGLSAGGYMGYVQGEAIPTDLNTLLGQAPANTKAVAVESAPGKQVMYSGAGYTLAEVALEDVFAKPFEQLMQSWVLDPLNMHNSSFAMAYPHQTDVRVALGHDGTGKVIDGGWRVHPEQAAAGLWSTAADLAKLAIELTNGYHGHSDVISQQAARQMLARVKPDEDLSAYFGGQPAMSFVTAGDEGERFLFKHSGGNMGYRSFMLMYPATGKGAVFLTNSDAGLSVGFELIRAAAAVYNWPDYQATTLTRRKLEPDEQAHLLGQYVFDNDVQLEVRHSDKADGIAILFPNGDVYPLTAVGEQHGYVHQDSGVEVSFAEADGRMSVFLYNQTAHKRIE